MSATPNDTERASVTALMTTLARASDTHFATRTRARRGSTR